jgi:hypothetical protein
VTVLRGSTRAVLGWQPTHPGLLADLEAASYFAMR